MFPICNLPFNFIYDKFDIQESFLTCLFSQNFHFFFFILSISAYMLESPFQTKDDINIKLYFLLILL